VPVAVPVVGRIRGAGVHVGAHAIAVAVVQRVGRARIAGVGGSVAVAVGNVAAPLVAEAELGVPAPHQTSPSMKAIANRWRAAGASAVVVGAQLSVAWEYTPPVFRRPLFSPPHTIIAEPVQTPPWW
jgi:hypothetical protein